MSFSLIQGCDMILVEVFGLSVEDPCVTFVDLHATQAKTFLFFPSRLGVCWACEKSSGNTLKLL